MIAESATGGALPEKVFLDLSQKSQKKTCARVSFLIKLQAHAWNFIKKDFAKFLRTPILQRTPLDDCFYD